MIILILKILGIVFLILLALLLLILSIILFVPFTYEIKGKYSDTTKIIGGAKVSWLFKGLKLKILYKENLKIRLSLFGKTLFSKKARSSFKSSFDISEIDSEEVEDNNYNTEILNSDKFHENIGVTDTVFRENINFDDVKTDNFKHENISKEDKSLEDKIIDLLFKVRDWLRPRYIKIKDAIDNFLYQVDNKLEYIETKIDKYIVEGNIKLGKKVFIRIGKLLLHVLPRKTHIYGELGFEDPCTTGQIFALSSFINPKFCDIDIIPEFDKEIKNIKIDSKGRIFIGYILLQALIIIVDKNFWKLLGTIRKDR